MVEGNFANANEDLPDEVNNEITDLIRRGRCHPMDQMDAAVTAECRKVERLANLMDQLEM